MPPPAVEVGPLTQEEECYMQSKAFTYSAQGKAPPEFEELENQASLGSSRMTAQEEAKFTCLFESKWGFCPQTNTGTWKLPLLSCTKRD